MTERWLVASTGCIVIDILASGANQAATREISWAKDNTPNVRVETFHVHLNECVHNFIVGKITNGFHIGSIEKHLALSSISCRYSFNRNERERKNWNNEKTKICAHKKNGKTMKIRHERERNRFSFINSQPWQAIMVPFLLSSSSLFFPMFSSNGLISPYLLIPSLPHLIVIVAIVVVVVVILGTHSNSPLWCICAFIFSFVLGNFSLCYFPKWFEHWNDTLQSLCNGNGNEWER